MPLDKSVLLEFLGEVEKALRRDVILVAAGGTAMTLLDLKVSTIDVDFTAPSADVEEFETALKSVPHGFRVDLWSEGMVFTQILPDDYLAKSVRVRTLGRIDLRALQPLDIVVTKIGRLDDRDLQDITACIESGRLTGAQVRKRAAQVEYVGNEEVYRLKVEQVMRKFFGQTAKR